MKFEEALAALREGKKVNRKYFIEKYPGTYYIMTPFGIMTFDPRDISEVSKLPLLPETRYSMVESLWIDNILATDWVIIE